MTPGVRCCYLALPCTALPCRAVPCHTLASIAPLCLAKQNLKGRDPDDHGPGPVQVKTACLVQHRQFSGPQSRQRPEVERGRCRSGGGSFSLHPRRPSLRGGVKSETIVELFCRKSPGGVSHLPQRPQRSSPCLIRPPSRCGLSAAVFPAVWIPPALVSLVRACGGASSAPTPRLLGASLPLRRYVRRGGVGTWPRGAVFPAFPVVHEDILQK